jgi:hypothetical protein
VSRAYSEKAKSCYYGSGSNSGSSSVESRPEMEVCERVIPFRGSNFCIGVGDGEGPEAKKEIHLGELRT